MSEIKVSGLSHVYSADTPFEKIAIHDVNVEIPHGQLVGLIGHTGSGKSTFIQHLNGLLVPTSGTVLVDSVNINGDKTASRDVRFKVGLVFQYPEYQLFEETVYADIAFGPKNMKLTESDIDERVREAAALVGVSEELFERSPLELSGGQKRRVAIAGVIAMRPGVLILDEPTAGLDPAGCKMILETICDYREKTGSTVVIVSHSMDDVARIADRLIVFNHGSIRFDGTPEEVFSNPKELSDIGLSVPAPTQIAAALREQGIEVEDSVYTNEQLLAALLKLKKEAGRNA
ncbi:MAG: energy-coupling factor transporter ATPase [Oscillospiraceae bacterium]|nr:energy-coupling factor transporter ATPase [Oscillospiraceae bacterium]